MLIVNRRRHSMLKRRLALSRQRLLLGLAEMLSANFVG